MLTYENAADYFEHEQKRLVQRQSANLPDEGRITQLLLPSPELNEDDHFPIYSLTHEVDSLEVDYRGIVGERHQAVTRTSGGRELNVYPRGTKIRGHRHLFVTCSSDLAELSRRMGVELTAEILGFNLVIGREDGEDFSLTELPVGTMMLINVTWCLGPKSTGVRFGVFIGGMPSPPKEMRTDQNQNQNQNFTLKPRRTCTVLRSRSTSSDVSNSVHFNSALK